MTTPNDDDMLARPVAKQAKRIDRSAAYLYKQIQQGHLKAYRPHGGTDLIVLDSDFYAWLTANDSTTERASGRGFRRGQAAIQ